MAKALAPGLKTADPAHRFIVSAPFQSRYLPNPINDDYLLKETAVYTHAGSKEYPRRQWTQKTQTSVIGGPP